MSGKDKGKEPVGKRRRDDAPPSDPSKKRKFIVKNEYGEDEVIEIDMDEYPDYILSRFADWTFPEAWRKILIYSGLSPYSVDELCLNAFNNLRKEESESDSRWIAIAKVCKTWSFWKEKYMYNYYPLLKPKEGLKESTDYEYWKNLCFTSYRRARLDISVIFKKILIDLERRNHEEVRRRVNNVIRSGILLEVGSNVNRTIGPDKITCLQVAAETRNEQLVELLLNSGAHVDETAFMFASKNGLLEIVRLFLENGADPNLQNKSSESTALMLASQSGRLEIVRLLLENGANPNLQNKYESTALLLASQSGRWDTVQLLLENGADPNLRNNSDYPLIIASAYGSLEMVRLLLENGADPNIQNKNSNSPLMIASQKGYLEIVRLLIENGADPNLRNNSNSPLMRAAEYGTLDLVQFLIDNGADVDAINERGENALIKSMVAIIEGDGDGMDEDQIRLIDFLVGKTRNMNAVNWGGKRSVLHILLDYGKNYVLKDFPPAERIRRVRALVKKMIRKGYDVNLKDKYGKTAGDYALQNEFKEIGEALKRMEERESQEKFDISTKIFVY